MKTKRAFLPLILSLGLFSSSASHAATAAQYATAVKLGVTHIGFVTFGFLMSDAYLWHWQEANGSARQYPLSSFSGDMLRHLQNQETDIIGSVKRGIKNGTYKQGYTYRVQASTSAMPRPSSKTDFTYAIGGCTVLSYADVTIGRADSRGNISCTVSRWVSVLSDIYTFNQSDSFSLAGYSVFPAGELYGFERAGLAKRFTVTTSPFYYPSLLGTFTAAR